MAEKGKAVYRIVIDGSQEAIFRELTDTSRPLPAIFNWNCVAKDALQRCYREMKRCPWYLHIIKWIP